MCGICGLVGLRGAPVDPEQLDAMNRTLRHRGPDSEGRYLDGPVGLAMRRLSIIDLEHGDQPVYNEDRSVVVVQNGEIYNYRELRQELLNRGHRFQTASDTEVLVHAYEEQGTAFLEQLRGMFALALWDTREQRLILARDPFGIKPLFYRVHGGRLSFASELKGLLQTPDMARDIDGDALHAYLSFNTVPAPATIFRDARKLQAGHMLIWERGNEPTIRRWARPRPAHDLIEGDEQMLVERLQARLRDSVKAHLVADVPVGVLLSGGIDSSLLAALASERVDRLQTFTIGFDERSFDERELARLVARRYSTDHHELLLRPDVTGLLPELVGVFDEPFADSSAIPTYLVSKLASSHVKVVLTGEGGDELFGGYFTYVADLLALRFGRAAATLEPLISLLPSSTAQASFDYRLKRFARGASLPPVDRHHSWRETFSARARADLLTPEWQTASDPLEFLRTRYAETEGAQPLARLQDLDVGGYLTDDLLVKTDRSSMANSLEARVPFLDLELASFAMALPDRHKVRRLEKKRLLRMAAAPLVPREIVEGRKRGFALPLAAWLRGDLVPLVREALSPETVRRQGFFQPGVVSDLIERHTSGREDLSRQLWSLLTFSLWHERYAGSDAPISTTSSARSSMPG